MIKHFILNVNDWPQVLLEMFSIKCIQILLYKQSVTDNIIIQHSLNEVLIFVNPAYSLVSLIWIERRHVYL